MNKVKYFQLVDDGQSVTGVEWPALSGEYAAKHDMYRVVEKDKTTYVLFCNSTHMSYKKMSQWIEQLMAGELTCVLVDLVSASNPISLRKPAMGRKRVQ